MGYIMWNNRHDCQFQASGLGCRQRGNMIHLETARQLKQAGLKWQPAQHDFFAIPERGFDERVFVITDMFANIERLLGSQVVAFQGASEWALDYLVTSEAVWMPHEEQLASLLLERLVGEPQPALQLSGSPESFRCQIAYRGQELSFEGADGGQAYAAALLHILEQEPPPPDPDEGGDTPDDVWERGLSF
jgi:hypothetical protein